MRFPKRIDLTGFVLESGERALIRVEIVGGSALATTEAFHLLLKNSERFVWWQIKHVSFNPDLETLNFVTNLSAAEVRLIGPSKIAEVVRERVTATILASTTYVTATRAKAVISLRRKRVGGMEENFIEIAWQGSPSPGAMVEAQLRGQTLLRQASF
jgi:hypothetical protein